LQRAVIAQAKCAVAMLDRTKLGRTAPQFLGGWEMVTGLLTDAPAEALAAEGISADMTNIEHIVSYLPSDRLKEVPVVEVEKAEEEPKKDENSHLTMPTSLL